MRKTLLPLTMFTAMLVPLMHALPAQAQRVFVAAQGSDVNPCTFAQPCRTFQHAHDTVAAGGEIDVLAPAGYGALTINKAISIQGHGFSGISVASSGTGITVNATATDKVNLSGLIIDGAGAGGNVGIGFNSGQSLTVENCAVRNLGAGLMFFNSATTSATLSVSNSHFTDNAAWGILVETWSSGAITAAIDGVTLSGNGDDGLELTANSSPAGTGALNVAVTDTVAGNNIGVGFHVQSATGFSVMNLVLTRSTASGNGTGIQASGTPATIWLAQSRVTENSTGYSTGSTPVGVIMSYGDNYIDVNGSNSGTLGSATKH
jgi:hypothetical protein